MLEKETDRQKLRYLISYLCHEKNKQEGKKGPRSLQEIVEDLRNMRISISPSMVSRLIKEAEEEGIIEITIRAPLDLKLAHMLEEQFSLSDARVALIKMDTVDFTHDYNFIRKSIAQIAADYLVRNINDGTKLGLSGGDTVKDTVELLSPVKQPNNIEVLPMSISKGPEHVEISPNVIVSFVCAKYHKAKAFGLEVPHFTLLDRKKFLNSPGVSNVLDKAEHVDIALIGIGIVTDESKLIQFITQSDKGLVDEIRKKDAIADVLDQFISSNGDVIDCRWNKDFVIAVSLRKLAEMAKNVRAHKIIGVAGGRPEKVAAIYSAMRYINCLITDSWTAQELLKMKARVKSFENT